MKRFGSALREARGEREIGLREFCRKGDLDPAFVSRIERGLLLPPGDKAGLDRFAAGLGLKPDSEAWEALADLAALSRGELPKDLLGEELTDRLPVLFRALRGAKDPRKLLDRLLRVLRDA